MIFERKIAARLRSVFEDAGFNEANVLAALGASDYWTSEKTYPPHVLHRIEGSELEPFMRLFVLRAPIDCEAALKTLSPLSEEELVGAGLLEMRDEARALVRILPQRGMFVLSDWPRGQEKLRYDYVMGLSPSTITVANLGVRGPMGDYLDLGTGSGFLAMLAAAESERVVAIDLNERAVAMARFNMELNRLTNVECLHGDMFAPVQNRKFDSILTNPPYVISPDEKFQFMDSSLGGEEFCKQLARKAPELLNDGGWFQMTFNWTEREGVEWTDQLTTWFEGTGCDAWVLRFERDDPDSYATAWIRQSLGDDPALYEERYSVWMKYFEELDIEAVSMGFVTMRLAPKSRNWIDIEDAPGVPQGSAGEQIRRVFNSRDHLASMSDDDLMAAVPIIAPGTRLEQIWVSEEERLTQGAFRVLQTEGLPYWGQIDRPGAGALATCDGRKTLRALLNEMAAEMEVPTSEVVDRALGAIKNLLATGLLEIKPA